MTDVRPKWSEFGGQGQEFGRELVSDEDFRHGFGFGTACPPNSDERCKMTVRTNGLPKFRNRPPMSTSIWVTNLGHRLCRRQIWFLLSQVSNLHQYKITILHVAINITTFLLPSSASSVSEINLSTSFCHQHRWTLGLVFLVQNGIIWIWWNLRESPYVQYKFTLRPNPSYHAQLKFSSFISSLYSSTIT